ncbi:MAG TPA: tRNA (adenosine(37)-N6)-threonylcarbamoyltransferase complex dimerization subunit type 1 TsaB [Phnomibacter sp.]|nr:tRNA (adenosine(37)-N6)-threonylcarbamoyltransferase complex dimerization subunit type 1 TsaB [Phnomibacter sp.]
MSLILCIDTSLQLGSVSLSKNGECIAALYSDQQQEHASFLQPAIQRLMEQVGMPLSALDAVAVSNGPGSYTGLRVGLASAKGLCFALNIPLITISSLQVMAHAMQQQVGAGNSSYLLCPMIDARRMEVFTAVYDAALHEVQAPSAVVLTPDFLGDALKEHTIYFAGNGADKWMQMVESPNAKIISDIASVPSLCKLAYEQAQLQAWANLAYAVPFYCKAFYQPTVANTGK